MHFLLKLLIFIYTLNKLISPLSCSNILGIISLPSYSHQMPMHIYLQALARRGHNITVLTPQPIQNVPENYTQIDLGFDLENWIPDEMNCPNEYSVILIMEPIFEMCRQVAEKEITTENFQRFIRNTNIVYDLIVIEMIPVDVFFSLVELFGNPPVIGFSTLSNFIYPSEFIGNPLQSPINPYYLSQTSQKMSLIQRILNFVYHSYGHYLVEYKFLNLHNELAEKHIRTGLKSVGITRKNLSLVFNYNNIIVNGIIANVATFVSVSGLHIGHTPQKPFPKGGEKFLNEASNGFIYISLGSNFDWSIVSEEIKKELISILKETGLRVLWKTNELDIVQNDINNLQFMFAKWCPQEKVLAHPNIRLFIYQGGLQSTQEAIYFGVPILAIPISFDQYVNAYTLRDKGVGLLLDLNHMYRNPIRTVMNELLNNASYRLKARKLAKFMRDRPMEPLDKAIWWTEYVIRNGGALHIRSPMLDLNFFQRQNLDVILICISFLVLGISIIFKMIIYIFQYKIEKKVKNE